MLEGNTGAGPRWERPYARTAVVPDLRSVHSLHYLRRKVLQALRQDFDARCCYCTGSEFERGGVEQFDVEHLRPKSKFPDLQLNYANLYYACRACNVQKGEEWPQPSTAARRFVDPCEEALYPTYLKIGGGGVLSAEKPPGEYLLSVFGFNSREQVRRTFVWRYLKGEACAAAGSGDPNRIRAALQALQEFERSLDSDKPPSDQSAL